MRKIIAYWVLIMGILIVQAFVTKADTAASVTTEQTTVKMANRQTATAAVTQEIGVVQMDMEKESPRDFIKQNWGALALGLMGFFDVIARLTPTQKDNTILNLLTTILNTIIPNYKKGGGRL